ncbi:hypothetical protein [Halanaerobium hydrogeniformans]|uniref:Uncharacterized protein n=1 Tax=Halanaerobium hydrogeniformans TaxID=656519 RepID=E4RMG9_HALHG|nr:hypothetical protein [Halanaerobium hydrogeniformans]ADQ14500.1 hypothetical protein Halsa_1062 [Halanaerobium hydrogeniformans]
MNEKNENHGFDRKIVGVTLDTDNGINRQKLLKVSKPGDELFLIPSVNEYKKPVLKVISKPLNEQLGWLEISKAESIYKWIQDGNQYKAEISEIIEKDNESKTLECEVYIEKNIQKVNKKSINKKVATNFKAKKPADFLTYKMHKASDKIKSVACLLTVFIISPLLLTMLLGSSGFGISIVIIILYFSSKYESV